MRSSEDANVDFPMKNHAILMRAGGWAEGGAGVGAGPPRRHLGGAIRGPRGVLGGPGGSLGGAWGALGGALGA